MPGISTCVQIAQVHRGGHPSTAASTPTKWVTWVLDVYAIACEGHSAVCIGYFAGVVSLVLPLGIEVSAAGVAVACCGSGIQRGGGAQQGGTHIAAVEELIPGVLGAVYKAGQFELLSSRHFMSQAEIIVLLLD